MLVIRSSDDTVILSVTDDEIEQLKQGNLATCFMTKPMSMKNIIIMYAKDTDATVKQVEALGIRVTKLMKDIIKSGKRTDALAKT